MVAWKPFRSATRSSIRIVWWQRGQGQFAKQTSTGCYRFMPLMNNSKQTRSTRDGVAAGSPAGDWVDEDWSAYLNGAAKVDPRNRTEALGTDGRSITTNSVRTTDSGVTFELSCVAFEMCLCNVTGLFTVWRLQQMSNSSEDFSNIYFQELCCILYDWNFAKTKAVRI